MIYPTSCADAAKLLGVTSATVSRVAARHGIGRRLGMVRLLSEADVEALRGKLHGKPGNPNFTPGNYFGGAKKRPGGESSRDTKCPPTEKRRANGGKRGKTAVPARSKK